MQSQTDQAQPQWAELLADAVSKPGQIHKAYSAFWNYSAGNQLLAMFECLSRKIAPGPLNTFLGWKGLGRWVRKGEKALSLWQPLSIKRKPVLDDDFDDENPPARQQTFTKFIFKARWFTLAQTEGADYQPEPTPGWDEQTALAVLDIKHVAFDLFAGNIQGYATGRKVSVSPIAFAPKRTLMHEIAHVLLGHTSKAGALADDDKTPRNLAEVEAEATALIVCESLGMSGVEHSRFYIQSWLSGQTIPEKSAQKIFGAADKIIKAGQPKRD